MSRSREPVPRRVESWLSFLPRARPGLTREDLPDGQVLTLDPGETTGYSLWQGGLPVDSGQWPTPTPVDMVEWIESVIAEVDLIVYEEYRVRGNKFKEHVGSEVVTIQHIGAIKVVAATHGIPLHKQTAGQVKAFATDRKLRQWGLYVPNHRHANDAIRHGVYYHLFIAGRKPRR